MRNLHSNMVRFIMHKGKRFAMDGKSIYIPIWLDLLFEQYKYGHKGFSDLHSNMVRFIIYMEKEFKEEINEFTFQYG